MSALTITLLVVGVIIFVLSFFLPDRADKESQKDVEEQRQEIRDLMEKELDSMKVRVNDVTNETVEYGMDKCERALERVSNEKIMAVNDYADTIMEEINKSHKEVMFLYDMLSSKQTDLKNTVRKAEATAREVNESVDKVQVPKATMAGADGSAWAADAAQQLVQGAPDKTTENRQQSIPPANNVPSPAGSGTEKAVYYNGNIDEGIFENMVRPTPAPQVKRTEPEPIFARVNIEPEEEETEAAAGSGQDDMTDDEAEPANNNQRILSLHKEGMSTVDIAKELGLGVGEVKLVIDLFKG